jgi:hypothetical protein
LTLCKKEKGTLGHILGQPWKKPKLHSTESHGGMTKFYRPQGRKLEHSKLIKTKGYQLMADLDKNRHGFLQTLRSFDSKLKPDIVLINESTKDIIIGELTCPMEALMAYWHETKTKKYHDLANRIAEKGFTVRFFAFEVGCRGLVGKSLRKFLTALELPKKIIGEMA